jgi:hypothetical protein
MIGPRKSSLDTPLALVELGALQARDPPKQNQWHGQDYWNHLHGGTEKALPMTYKTCNEVILEVSGSSMWLIVCTVGRLLKEASAWLSWLDLGLDA